MPGPTSDDQIRFLVNLQRLLEEGQFVATYKYALLIALADIAVEKGTDDSSPLDISTRQIAEKFIGYYWRQCAPYSPFGQQDARLGVLRQNTGRQAGIVSLVEAASGFEVKLVWRLPLHDSDFQAFRGLMAKGILSRGTILPTSWKT